MKKMTTEMRSGSVELIYGRKAQQAKDGATLLLSSAE